MSASALSLNDQSSQFPDMFDVDLTPSAPDRPLDPADVFSSLTLRGPVVNIWAPQADALKSWHGARKVRDCVVEMDTGGGKTLVGLVIARSLVNEFRRGVVYACPNNQLVAQVAAQAGGLGIPVATYMGRQWSDRDVFTSAEGPCVTSYASVFNGRSIFRGEDVAALLLDDAHVAAGVLRGQFTISLPLTPFDRDAPSLSLAARQVVELFADEVAKGQGANTLEGVVRRGEQGVLFVPTFAAHDCAAELDRILRENGVATEKKTLFAWEHLKDHIQDCAILIGRGRVEITPPVLPLWNAEVYERAERRVYLTATVPSDAELVRTFGVANPTRVRPGGRSGEAQRFFAFPAGDDDAQRTRASAIVADRKALVIVPSGPAAKRWDAAYDSEADHGAEIAAFAVAAPPKTLVLAARYDGIDLPGRTCNVLVLDGLPRGENLLDAFVEDTLRALTIREQRTAVRITQALGRIFRNNTDHGAVLVIGRRLRDWLSAPVRRRLLPDLIQKQLRLGLDFSPRLADEEIPAAIDRVVAGDPRWDEMYKNYLARAEPEGAPEDPTWLVEASKMERRAYRLLWEGEPQRAAESYARAFAAAEPHERPLAAWLLHWGALATLTTGDRAAAAVMFRRAANTKTALGRLGGDTEALVLKEPSAQAIAIAQVIRKQSRATHLLNSVEVGLIYGEEHTPKAEEAVRALGEFLGFVATRPDKEEGLGPDVLWVAPVDVNVEPGGAWFELKTGKEPEAVYQKNDDIGQALNHYEYVKRAQVERVFLPRIVGRILPVARQSSPPDDLGVIPLESLQGLAERARAMAEALMADIRARGEEGNPLEPRVQAWIEREGLTWPECIDSLDTTLAVDLIEV